MLDLDKLGKAFSEIKKEHGDAVIIDPGTQFEIARIPLSSPILGDLMGQGGCPCGRILEFSGKESSGKSLLATLVGVDYQKAGKYVVYIDLEQAFSYQFAQRLGLDISSEKFKLFQPNVGEEAYDILQRVVETGQVGLVIFDSIAAMTSIAENEAGFDEMQMGSVARLQGKGLRKVTALLSKTGTTLIFVNQIRQRIGGYGPATTTTGGEATKYFSSIRMEINKKENITGKDEEDIIGIRSRIKCIKNKTEKPFKSSEIDIYFDRGLDVISQYFDIAVDQKIIDKAGAWYSFKETKVGQGRDNSIKYLKENMEEYTIIKNLVDSLMFPNRKEFIIEDKKEVKEEKEKKVKKTKVEESLVLETVESKIPE